MIFDLSRSIFRLCGSNFIWQTGGSDTPPSDLMLALVSAGFGGSPLSISNGEPTSAYRGMPDLARSMASSDVMRRLSRDAKRLNR